MDPGIRDPIQRPDKGGELRLGGGRLELLSGVHGGVGVLLSMEKGRRRGVAAGCCCSGEHRHTVWLHGGAASRSNSCTVLKCNPFGL